MHCIIREKSMSQIHEPVQDPTPSAEDQKAQSADLDDLRQSLESALRLQSQTRHELGLLNEILDQLPVGVTVRAEDGSTLFANETARVLGDPAAIEPAASSSGENGPWNTCLPDVDPDRTVTMERRFLSAAGPRTLLTTQKSVLIGDERLRLATSFDITERKQVEEELSRRAYFDELTGLPNRYQFQERVEAKLATPDAHFAMAIIDIDNFKQINDFYSHAVGDAFLIKAGDRIKRLLRDEDVLARISGDEFMLLLRDIDFGDNLEKIILAITSALKEPFIIDAQEIFSSASIGVAAYPEHGLNYETLRRNADRAMNLVKKDTKGAAALFQQHILESETSRVLAEQRLRLAIQDRRFCCAFQPKVDITTEEIIGVEALVRLLGEDGEIHGPGSFIDLATELNLIDDLTHLVVGQIANSIDLINEAFGPKVKISVNISARQATDFDFMHSIAESLRDTNCSERFIVEVTEDAFVAKNRFQTQVVPMLREIGVGVSIDDFGTGYSSLSALADITADEIKVDRSFITNIHERPRSQIVLRAIESLGGALGMTVVAEGVERYEELLYLKTATRIRIVQGYYFARPMLLEDFSATKRAPAETRVVHHGAREASQRRNVGRRQR
jgi:cyclic di-GMP phosphodiesterase Gmr